MSRAIVVLGMHRSGTSALTRVISLLGAALPRNLLAPRPNDNETGFWESKDLGAIHEEIFESLGSGYDEVGSIPREWFEGEQAERFRLRILQVLRRDLDLGELFVLKDPRMCRLLPLWRQVFHASGVSPAFVLSIRHPLEVAASLHARNGFSIEKSLLLWLRHVLESEEHTRGAIRSIVHYESLLLDWRAIVDRLARELVIEWPAAPQSAADEIDRFLAAGLRHHVRHSEDFEASPFSGWVRDVYQAFRAPPLERHIEVLERVRHELARANYAFGGMIHETQAPSPANEPGISPLRAVGLWLSLRARNGRENDTACGALGRASFHELVEALYRGLLGREPDPDGYAWHRDRLENGASRRDIIRDVLESREFHARVRGALDGGVPATAPPSAWLQAVYQVLFRRRPEPSELTRCRREIERGVARGDLLEQLVWSGEFSDRNLPPKSGATKTDEPTGS